MKQRIAPVLSVLALVALVALLGGGGEVSGQNAATARISSLDVALAGNQLVVDFQLIGGFGDDLQKRIDSGLPTSLVYELELARDRRSWFDKSVAGGELRVIAMYNALTREYLVNFKHDGKLIGSKVVREPAELRRAMTEIDDLAAFSVEGLAPEDRFQLRVRAELGTGTIFFFIPHTLRTDWAETATFRLRDLADKAG